MVEAAAFPPSMAEQEPQDQGSEAVDQLTHLLSHGTTPVMVPLESEPATSVRLVDSPLLVERWDDFVSLPLAGWQQSQRPLVQ